MKFDKDECLRWCFGNLLDNATRGVVAEFIVAKALGVASGNRKEWDFADLKFNGLNIEVKSSAYVQSWEQDKPSRISFDIKPRKQMWDADTNTTREFAGPKRPADIYVFCLLAETDEDKIDPLDTKQWAFYVISTEKLNETFGSQKTLGLSSLEKMVKPVVYSEIEGQVVG